MCAAVVGTPTSAWISSAAIDESEQRLHAGAYRAGPEPEGGQALVCQASPQSLRIGNTCWKSYFCNQWSVFHGRGLIDRAADMSPVGMRGIHMGTNSETVTLVKKQTMAHIGPHCAPGSITQSPSAVLPPQTGGAIIAALYLQKERIHVQVSPLRDDYNGFLVSETRASEAFNVPPWLFSQCRCDQV
ncbi:hypothetical protein Q8A73_012052 [Channa argus]|nr:hypothetical protein Q8A73_012052 [Channa argus]